MTEKIEKNDFENSLEQLQLRQSAKRIKRTPAKKKFKIIINISDCQYPVVSRVATKLGWKIQESPGTSNWDVLWTDNAVLPEVLAKMQPHQKINHFPGMANLARKNLMGRSLMKMRKKFPDHFSFFPMTWMLPFEYHEFKSYFETRQKGKARTFIVKPEALSQGKGIFLTRKLEDIDQNCHCVVQKYIHRPYLIEGLKFDMRVYVLVASVDPLRLFIYNQGLVRFATQKYEMPTQDNLSDTCMHLTNYAINKQNPKFIFNSSSTDMSRGHKRSLGWLFQYLEKHEINGKKLKDQIEEIIVKTMISGLPVISNTYRLCQSQNYASNMCFELLGFDVMLTEKCQPILLEINHTPSFATDTPLDDLIKTNFIHDSLALMNINISTKQNIIKQKREACQRRVMTGKKIKISNNQKQKERKKAQEERQNYELKNLGGFKKIYPIDHEQKMSVYKQLLKHSQDMYNISTGTKKTEGLARRKEKSESAFGTCFKKLQRRENTSLTKTRQHRVGNELIIPSQNSYVQQKNTGQIKGPCETVYCSSLDSSLMTSKTLFAKKMNNNISSISNVDLTGHQQKFGSLNNYLSQAIVEEQSIKQKQSNQKKECLNTWLPQKSVQLSRKLKLSNKNSIANKEVSNNIEIFLDTDHQADNLKNCIQILFSNTDNISSSARSEHLRLENYRANIMSSEKPKVMTKNSQSQWNIQNLEGKGREWHQSSREKIPIHLNTLMIGSKEGPHFGMSKSIGKILNFNLPK